jgi:hypothetical protein
MIVAVVLKPVRWAARITSSQRAVGAEHRAHLVVEDLGGGARQGAEAGMFQAAQELRDRQSKRGSALVHLER